MATPKHWNGQNIKIAADAVIFTVQNNDLKVLLIQMKRAPFTDKWAVPGGLIKQAETSKDATIRILNAQTGVKSAYLEQLQTFDDIKRDPLGRVISITYFALLPSGRYPLKTSEKYKDVRWVSIKKLPPLAYDHKTVIKLAHKRLKAKLGYTNIVWSLLPKEFTLTDLQATYETILGKKLDKRNFRRKLLSLDLIKPTGRKQTGQANRPAALYSFKSRSFKEIDIMHI